MKKIFTTLCILSLLASCSDLKNNIQHDFSSAITKNATAKSHIEWESSEAQPKIIFSKYRDQYVNQLSHKDPGAAEKLGTEICKGLALLSDESLALFETEIGSVENTEMLTACRETLLERINLFHKDGRKGLQYSTDALSKEPSNIDFKLKMEVNDGLDINSFNKYYAGLKDHEVILTFDDGPDAEYTDSILKTLHEAGDLKAIFFTLGKNVKEHPSFVVSEHKAGHVVANHSWNHYCLDESEVCRTYNIKNFNHLGSLSDLDVQAEIEKTYEVINDAIGTVEPFFRFPFGNARASAAQYLKDRGVYVMNWSIDSNDWRHMQSIAGQELPYTNKDMIKNVITAIEAKKKGVILFHDIQRRTAESLPQVLFELYKLNYKVILLKAPPIEAIRINHNVVRPPPERSSLESIPFFDMDP